MRGGYIVPYQDVSGKYILNTEQLRNEKLNLIVNLDDFNPKDGDEFHIELLSKRRRLDDEDLLPTE